MNKKDFKIKPVDQELTKEDLKKFNGGSSVGYTKPCKNFS